MHWAVLGNHLPVLDFLLKKGAFPDSYDAHDDSPLHIAARCALANSQQQLSTMPS